MRRFLAVLRFHTETLLLALRGILATYDGAWYAPLWRLWSALLTPIALVLISPVCARWIWCDMVDGFDPRSE